MDAKATKRATTKRTFAQVVTSFGGRTDNDDDDDRKRRSIIIDLLYKIKTVDEFIQLYDYGGLVHECLQRIVSAHNNSSSNNSGKDPETWAKEWAQQLLVNDKEANNLDRDKEFCLKFLFTLCNRWKGWKGTKPTISDEQMVHDFQSRRILGILQLCLVMDRAKTLYFMRGIGKAEPGIHWFAERHVELLPEWKNIMIDYEGEPSINKRYLWLMDLKELGLDRYKVLRKWMTPVKAPCWISHEETGDWGDGILVSNNNSNSNNDYYPSLIANNNDPSLTATTTATCPTSPMSVSRSVLSHEDTILSREDTVLSHEETVLSHEDVTTQNLLSPSGQEIVTRSGQEIVSCSGQDIISREGTHILLGFARLYDDLPPGNKWYEDTIAKFCEERMKDPNGGSSYKVVRAVKVNTLLHYMGVTKADDDDSFTTNEEMTFWAMPDGWPTMIGWEQQWFNQVTSYSTLQAKVLATLRLRMKKAKQANKKALLAQTVPNSGLADVLDDTLLGFSCFGGDDHDDDEGNSLSDDDGDSPSEDEGDSPSEDEEGNTLFRHIRSGCSPSGKEKDIYSGCLEKYM